MATSLEKKFTGSQLANRATGSTPIPITPNTPGTMLTMASHTRNAAMVFGSVEHTATPSTMQATVNGNAAATPLSRMNTASVEPSSSSTALPTYTAKTTAMTHSPSAVATRHFPANRSRREQPCTMAFLNVPSFRSSANSTHTSKPAMKNSNGSIEMRLLIENRTVA